MPSSKIERKLAAIMFTDIVGSTAQMSKDEAVAISLLNKKESILKLLIKKHNGTYVKSTGDGSLSHFNSAVDAATCAKRLQESIYDDKDLNVRVGVHLGDTIFEKGDIRGDGVNIAARLESMAVEGGVFVSKEVHDQLANQKEFDGVSLGLQSMKGVGRLIEVYGLKSDKLSEPNPSDYKEDKITIHSDDEVPSIAIIPFRNKGKEEDAFYAYGICADLISDVSSAGLIRVASKKQIEDVGDLPQDELSKKLDVRYMANGELWRMGDMFQLSVELYDTKNKKVVWSDRWQEKWDNLPSIKSNLSDGLLKALYTTSKVERMVESTNTEAYEYYLKAKYKYEKRDNKEDIIIARGLINKAIELDDKLIKGKLCLGRIYLGMGEYDKAMETFKQALKQAEEQGNQRGVFGALTNLGILHSYTNSKEDSLKYFEKSLQIAEELGDNRSIGGALINIGVNYEGRGADKIALQNYERSLLIAEDLGNKYLKAKSLSNLGAIYSRTGDYEQGLIYFEKSLLIYKDREDKSSIAGRLNNIGYIYANIGNYDISIDYYERSLAISDKLSNRRRMGYSLNNIGILKFNIGVYKIAEKYLEKSLSIQKEIGHNSTSFETTIFLYLTYKHLGKEYDKNDIHTIIKDAEKIEYELNLRLYELLEDTSYLKSAYNQVQEKADNLEPDVAAKFLSYPIPKAIVEEWEKVK